MLEPEIPFLESLDQLMDISEDLIKNASKHLMEQDRDLSYLNIASGGQLEVRWNMLLNLRYKRMSYTEAITALQRFTNIEWGAPLAYEHERLLMDKIAGGPVFVTDYPKETKAFYMRLNDDQRTVACFDFLIPGVGELIGGSLREERVDSLEQRLQQIGISSYEHSWYLDLRRYGSVPHGGFGIGFERFLQYMTGMSNIRDVCFIPRDKNSRKY